MTERTIGEFLDKLRKPEIWKQIAGMGTDKQTSEWVLEETIKAVLMGDEMARLNGQLFDLTMERDKVIRENEKIQKLNQQIAETQLKMKNLNNWMDMTLGKVYTVLGAKLDDLREHLELPKPKEIVGGMEVE
jgi:hypothetical protein